MILLELENKLRDMFMQIQAPYLKHARSMFEIGEEMCFFSYNFCLHKFFQLLGEDEYIQLQFNCKKNFHKQEQIWKKICEELGWKYIKSL